MLPLQCCYSTDAIGSPAGFPAGAIATGELTCQSKDHSNRLTNLLEAAFSFFAMSNMVRMNEFTAIISSRPLSLST